MAVRMRLTRVGSKKNPIYRVVERPVEASVVMKGLRIGEALDTA